MQYMIGGPIYSFKLTINKTREDEGFSEIVKKEIEERIKGNNMPLADYKYQIEEL